MKCQQKYKSESTHHSERKIKQWKKLLHQSPSFTPFMTEIRIYPTFEGTFLMTHESYPDKKLIHFDKNGNILVEQNYATSQHHQLSILNNKTVVLLRLSDGDTQCGDLDVAIDCIDLEVGVREENEIYLNSNKQDRSEVSFFVFRESGLICVCQNMFRTTKNQHAVGFILNFFELDKKTLQLQKLFSEQLEMPLENIDYKYKGVKLNQISKIGFIPQQTMPMTKETIPIYIYDLGTQFKNVSEDSERVKSFQFPNKIQGKIQDCCGVAVKEMWEIGKNTYYLKLQKALNFDKYLNRSWDENIFKSVGTQFQFIWNSNTNISRSTTYEPPQKHYLIQFIHSLRPITVFKKQILTKNPTQKKIPRNELQSVLLPVYLVSCFNEHEFIQEKIQIFDGLRKCYPIFTKDQIMNYQLKQQTLVKTIQYDKRMLTAYLSLEFFQQFDQDLLSMMLDLTDH